MNAEQLKRFALLVLNDEWGIPADAYSILNDALVEAVGAGGKTSSPLVKCLGFICSAVRITEDRAYLPPGVVELWKDNEVI